MSTSTIPTTVCAIPMDAKSSLISVAGGSLFVYSWVGDPAQRKITVHALADGRLRHEVPLAVEGLSCATASRDGNRIAVAGPVVEGGGSGVRVYETATGSLLYEHADKGDEDGNKDLAFDAAGTRLFIAGCADRCWVHDLNAKTCTKGLSSWDGRESDGMALAPTGGQVTPDAIGLAVKDGLVWAFALATGEVQWQERHNDAVLDARMSDKATDGIVRSRLQARKTALSADGRVGVSTSFHHLTVWRMNDGQAIQRIALDEVLPSLDPLKNDISIQKTALTADGRLLVVRLKEMTHVFASISGAHLGCFPTPRIDVNLLLGDGVVVTRNHKAAAQIDTWAPPSAPDLDSSLIGQRILSPWERFCKQHGVLEREGYLDSDSFDAMQQSATPDQIDTWLGLILSSPSSARAESLALPLIERLLQGKNPNWQTHAIACLRRAAPELEDAILHDPRGDIKPALQQILSLLQQHAPAAAEHPEAKTVAATLHNTP